MKPFAAYRPLRTRHFWRYTVTLVAWTFVGLFLFAAFHEVIPGLCTLLEEDGTCAFCELIFTLAVAAVVVALARLRGFAEWLHCAAFSLPPQPTPPAYLPARAPPVSA